MNGGHQSQPRVRSGNVHRRQAPAGSRPFTLRQIAVVRLIAEGLSSKEIAARLNIQPGSAKAHADVIRAKLDGCLRRQIPAEFMRRTGIDPYPRPDHLNSERPGSQTHDGCASRGGEDTH